MKDRIKSLKSAIESSEQDHAELVEALEKLEKSLSDDFTYPGEESLIRAISETVDRIEKENEPESADDNILSQKWAGLADELDKWENEHPGFTLIIGDIARALSISGI